MEILYMYINLRCRPTIACKLKRSIYITSLYQVSTYKLFDNIKKIHSKLKKKIKRNPKRYLVKKKKETQRDTWLFIHLAR